MVVRQGAICSALMIASVAGGLQPAVAQGVRGASAETFRLAPYRLNPGDEIEVYVWGEERLQRTVRILPDGSFAFPLVGRLEAAGKLPSQIEDEVSKGLVSQFRDRVPQVTVSVKAATGLQFSVIGRVKSPGSYTPGKYVNVLEAIGLAGGPTEFAELGNVLILRKQGTRLMPIRIRLTDAVRGNPTERDLNEGLPTLQTGDTVIVP